jgi:phospholipid/cholesterol/gamma-HCH transport system ATP-binding protein
LSEEIAIALEDVRKSFGKQEIARGIDLEVRKGQITVVIGLSGAGKSVLLKLMSGLLAADSGSIVVGGAALSSLDAREKLKLRSRFGIVFQHGALFDSMNVFDNVAFPLREHSRLSETEVKTRVLRRLDDVGLVEHGRKMPSELSGGMRKRAGLARALIREPEFLLYDEPTTGLDPIRTASIDDLIVRMQKANPAMTSVVISHDMEATFRIADRIAMLYEGRIIAECPNEAFRKLDDPRVRQFVEGRQDGPIDV